jgi:hypothetical protein
MEGSRCSRRGGVPATTVTPKSNVAVRDDIWSYRRLIVSTSCRTSRFPIGLVSSGCCKTRVWRRQPVITGRSSVKSFGRPIRIDLNRD